MTRPFLALALVVLACLAAMPHASATYPTRPPCGAATDPVCWGSKFACQIYGPLVEDTPLECENFTTLELIEVASSARDDAAPFRPTALRNLVDDVGEGEGACRNFGVVVMVTGIGTNRYCTEGECENSGVIVMVGYSESCYGQGYGTVCIAETCVVGPDGVTGVDSRLLP
ncbi:MAG TPA: hypothetical protein VM370_08270 [Candidatus Thermoplasmatota archaeon]|nr:hypothetical protein [Candidatus Thermoplasmatota archaeon]